MTDPLAPLRQRFRARAKQDLAQLRSLVDGDLEAHELRMLVHGLAGAAGTFGYADLSAAAMSIDDRYVAGQTPVRELFVALEQRLSEVGEAD